MPIFNFSLSSLEDLHRMMGCVTKKKKLIAKEESHNLTHSHLKMSTSILQRQELDLMGLLKNGLSVLESKI